MRNEISLHQQMQHPQVIKFVDCLQIGNIVYFLLEFAANGCLFFYIHSQEGLPEPLAPALLRPNGQSGALLARE